LTFEARSETLREAAQADPLEQFSRALAAGRIGALLGFGGFHLVCRADQDAIVAELRTRKGRPHKPFAVMVRDLEVARRLAQVSDSDAELLQAARGPIVLVRKQTPDPLSVLCAPGLSQIGLFLPYSGLHLRLFEQGGFDALIMTSANLSSAPMIHHEASTLTRTWELADVRLSHNRVVATPCEDSVVRAQAEGVQFIRRSRGYVPSPLALPQKIARLSALAVGGHQKATFAIAKGGQACLSPFLGDLGHFDNYLHYAAMVERWQRLFEVRPELVIHDAHPGYASSEFAREHARALGVPCVTVQHHHAHFASVLVEHGIEAPALGVIFDGSGYGDDGAVWGGEFLLGDLEHCTRVGHLRPFRLPGGERAVHEPFRVAVSLLLQAKLEPGRWLGSIPPPLLEAIGRLCHSDRSEIAPLSTSVGRLFDAVAALVLGRTHTSYAGQAPVELESLAETCDERSQYPFEFEGAPKLVVDWRPLLAALVKDLSARVSQAQVARRFHNTLIAFSVEASAWLAQQHGVSLVVLSGGVFHNEALLRGVTHGLRARGLTPIINRQVAPNDSGLCLGQLAVGMARACA
jgi:hydrogenase maturation protein HypF